MKTIDIQRINFWGIAVVDGVRRVLRAGRLLMPMARRTDPHVAGFLAENEQTTRFVSDRWCFFPSRMVRIENNKGRSRPCSTFLFAEMKGGFRA